jgi:hypothetical protein
MAKRGFNGGAVGAGLEKGKEPVSIECIGHRVVSLHPPTHKAFSGTICIHSY